LNRIESNLIESASYQSESNLVFPESPSSTLNLEFSHTMAASACACLHFVVSFCLASDVHWLVLVPFGLCQYDCRWVFSWPFTFMRLKIMASFTTSSVPRVSIH